MSRLDELPPDQRAALSLLLRRRKSYAEVAASLGIAERAVHDRAHAALAVLAPSLARGLPAERRAQVIDYVLSQQAAVAERLRARSFIGSSPQAQEWAHALVSELAPLARAGLPDIPTSPAAVIAPQPEPSAATPNTLAALSAQSSRRAAQASEAASARGSSASAGGSSSPAQQGQPVSRLGGALLLAALVVAVVVAVVLITTSGGSSDKHATGTTSASTATGAAKAGPTVSAQQPLRSPNPASRSVGVFVVLSEKEKHAFYIEAQQLAPTRGFYYAIWLYNSPTSALALSRGPAVGASRKLAGGSGLPANAAQFHELLLTRETSAHPTHPGTVVLRGPFLLG